MNPVFWIRAILGKEEWIWFRNVGEEKIHWASYQWKPRPLRDYIRITWLVTTLVITGLMLLFFRSLEASGAWTNIDYVVASLWFMLAPITFRIAAGISLKYATWRKKINIPGLWYHIPDTQKGAIASAILFYGTSEVIVAILFNYGIANILWPSIMAALYFTVSVPTFWNHD